MHIQICLRHTDLKENSKEEVERIDAATLLEELMVSFCSLALEWLPTFMVLYRHGADIRSEYSGLCVVCLNRCSTLATVPKQKYFSSWGTPCVAMGGVCRTNYVVIGCEG